MQLSQHTANDSQNKWTWHLNGRVQLLLDVRSHSNMERLTLRLLLTTLSNAWPKTHFPHPKLCNVSEIEARRQIAESRTALEVVLHTPVTLFSFPYGAFDENLVRWCREARYERVFTTLPIPALSDSKEFICGRVVVEPTDWPLDFFLKIQGAYSWLPLAFSLKRKLKQAFQIRNRNHRKMKTQIESDS